MTPSPPIGTDRRPMAIALARSAQHVHAEQHRRLRCTLAPPGGGVDGGDGGRSIEVVVEGGAASGHAPPPLPAETQARSRVSATVMLVGNHSQGWR